MARKSRRTLRCQREAAAKLPFGAEIPVAYTRGFFYLPRVSKLAIGWGLKRVRCWIQISRVQHVLERWRRLLATF
jgi:hypothetical protein